MKIRMKWEGVMPMARYTDFWRQARKLLDRDLRAGALAVYRPVQQTRARAFLVNLLENPDGLETHLE
jgi:hypothetical protein